MGIQERSSHSIQSLAFSAVGTRGLEELIHSLLYEVREYTEWPKERSSKPSSIGTNDPWCLYALLLCITMASPSRSSSGGLASAERGNLDCTPWIRGRMALIFFSRKLSRLNVLHLSLCPALTAHWSWMFVCRKTQAVGRFRGQLWGSRCKHDITVDITQWVGATFPTERISYCPLTQVSGIVARTTSTLWGSCTTGMKSSTWSESVNMSEEWHFTFRLKTNTHKYIHTQWKNTIVKDRTVHLWLVKLLVDRSWMSLDWWICHLHLEKHGITAEIIFIFNIPSNEIISLPARSFN